MRDRVPASKLTLAFAAIESACQDRGSIMAQYAPVATECRFETAPVPDSDYPTKSMVWRSISRLPIVRCGRDE